MPLVSSARREGGDSVVWGLVGEERERVIQALMRGDDPGGASERPWAAVVLRGNGDLVATSSPTLSGGLCWTVDADRAGERELVIGHDVGAVVRARRSPTELDGEWLRSKLSGFLSSRATTPYMGVHLVPFGATAVWRAGARQPRVSEWFGPDSMPQPTLSGPEANAVYLRSFDATIEGLVEPGQPMASTLSGGLDSSFMVASLARLATPDNPVHCYTHSPHPDAGLQPKGNWDPDDYEYALAMQRAYPDRVVVHRVVNTTRRDPLDFVEESSLAAWVPNFNVNGMWFEAMADDAARRGATTLFSGTNGNSAFSYDHPYAGGYYLRRGDLRSVAHLVGPAARQGRSFSGNLRSLVAPAVTGYRIRRGAGPLPSYLAAVGLGWLAENAPATFSSSPTTDRGGYLAWLTRARNRPLAASPLAWAATPVDPFATRRMCALAASMEPRHWRRGALPRGFARELGVGRVPDEIRLRTRRGSQSADLWFAMRGHRERYLDEIDRIQETPHLGGWVDHVALRRSVEAWPWGDGVAPGGWSSLGLIHVLGLAGFVRATSTRLAS